MEGAARVFAQDLQAATLCVPSPDGSGLAWVVTPGGAWCRQVFLAGALTEVVESGDFLRCRLADPTGAFDLVTGGKPAPVSDMFKTIHVPAFVTVSGTVHAYQKNSGMVVTVRPEKVHVVDRAMRDRIVLDTAEQTIERLEQIREAVAGRSADERMLTVVRHYALTPARLQEIAAMVRAAVQGVQVVVPASVAVPEDTSGVREQVMAIMRAGSGPRGIAVQDIIDRAAGQGIASGAVLAAIESLILDDECYQPLKGYVKPL
ncbi:MAG: hypothetical protein ABFC71_06455 [Methanoregula sp.]